jgi:hypothetical protein
MYKRQVYLKLNAIITPAAPPCRTRRTSSGSKQAATAYLGVEVLHRPLLEDVNHHVMTRHAEEAFFSSGPISRAVFSGLRTIFH